MSDIARWIGIPLKIDKATAEGEFGRYARMLFEMDVSAKPIDNLLVERVGKSFFIEVAYENLPVFCSTCSFIGHVLSDCRLNKDKAENTEKQAEV